MAVKIRVQRGQRVDLFDALTERLLKPFSDEVGTAIAAAVRHGAGSVEQQFEREATIGNTGGTIPWKRSGFSRNKALRRTGRLKNAWLGRGSASLTVKEPFRVAVGVSDSQLPHAAMFQNRGAFVGGSGLSPAKRRAMRLAIGLKHNIWITQETIDYGLRIDPRPVSVNPAMIDRIRNIVLGHVVTGEAPTRRAA